MGVKHFILVLKLELGPTGYDLDIEARIWPPWLRFWPQDRDVGRKSEVWATMLIFEL